MTQTYTVTGMTCHHCVTSVTEELSEIAEINDVQVELSTGSVTISSQHPIAIEHIRTAVQEAGYQLQEI